jgi:hypothetical protein
MGGGRAAVLLECTVTVYTRDPVKFTKGGRLGDWFGLGRNLL